MLYSLPLHGVGLAPYFKGRDDQVENILALNFQKLPSHIFEQERPLWKMTDVGDRYQSKLAIYKVNKAHYLQINCQGNGVVEFNDDAIRVDWQSDGTDAMHYLQTIGLALYLELNGNICIHANALSYGEHCIGLMAPSGTGKSTLSVRLADMGYDIMTDDMVALYNKACSFHVYPSWPVIRMWPGDCEQLTGMNINELPRVHDRFDKKRIDLASSDSTNSCIESKRLTTLYYLNRDENFVGEPSISEVPAARALMLLIQNSMLGDAYKSLSLENDRLAYMAKVFESITFKEINYGNGSQQLKRVCDLIADDRV